MRSLSALCHLVVLSVLVLAAPVSPAADPVSTFQRDAATSSVSPDTLKSKIKEVEATTNLDEADKSRLTELYRKALSFHEQTDSNTAAAGVYRKARETAAQEARAVRDKLEAEGDREVTIEVTEETPPAEIEQALLKEKANRSAIEAKLSDIEQRLVFEADRPTKARQQLSQASQRQDQLVAEYTLPEPEGELPALTEARRWVLESENLAVSTQVKMLDQELLSYPMRLQLLEAQRDASQRSLERTRQRVQMLETLLSTRRVAEAEEAKTQAEEAKREAMGKHPLVGELAEKNADLGEELTLLAADMDRITAEDGAADREAKRVEELYQSTRQKMELAGLSQALGRVLLEQRRNLPKASVYQKQAAAREKETAEAGLRLIGYEEERRLLRNIPDYVNELTADLPEATAEEVRPELTSLANSRRDLLGQATQVNHSYLRSLGELDFAQRQLLSVVKDYNDYLDERLLWIRSISGPSREMFRAVPNQIIQLLSPHHWQDVLNTLLERLTQSPVFGFLILVVTVLLWKSRQMRQVLLESGKHIGRAKTDRYANTFNAFILTLLLGLPWPLLAGVTGWQLGASVHAADFTKAVSQGFLWVAPTFFYLLAFRVLCMPGGLAEAHFHWQGDSLRLLRRELDILLVTFIPASFIAVVIIKYDSSIMGGGIGRTALIFLLMALAYFFYRVLDPRRGVLAGFMRRHPMTLFSRLRYFWLVLAVAIPVTLAGLVVFGYLYTAGTLLRSLVDTLWMVLTLTVVHQMIMRWLLLTHRKLAFQAAIKRRDAARAVAEEEPGSDEGGPEMLEEAHIDYVALSEETHKLLNIALVIVGVIGVWIIWSEVLPAFGILRDINLWHHTATVDGIEQRVPVTLADLALSLLMIIGTVVATKRFPALLEILLLRHLNTTPGGRYTAITLSRYAIIGIGISIAIGMIGGSWGQIQWLVAALGVGIGFGLQEIVANFISGLIILFERPIRVGDIVTVGETDGVVTRIQIRATTIRNWDRKELLVPNKEFITQRLLNWSLSDQVTRLIIPVGVAYGSDVDRARTLMLEAARENQHVIDDPDPYVTFETFGDNALGLNLRCFIDDLDYRIITITELHVAINNKLNEAGIVIAFPQRDVHLDTSQPLDIRLHRDKPAPEGSG